MLGVWSACCDLGCGAGGDGVAFAFRVAYRRWNSGDPRRRPAMVEVWARRRRGEAACLLRRRRGGLCPVEGVVGNCACASTAWRVRGLTSVPRRIFSSCCSGRICCCSGVVESEVPLRMRCATRPVACRSGRAFEGSRRARVPGSLPELRRRAKFIRETRAPVLTQASLRLLYPLGVGMP